MVENIILTAMIYVLNGPNLNLLGLREPEVYGNETLQDVENLCRLTAEKSGVAICFFQSNIEGAMIDWIHDAIGKASAIVINPAAYSHTSISILDALQCFNGLVAEVHISNIHRRESFRHHSYVSLRADCVISGCGIAGYRIAIDFLAERLKSWHQEE
ncbi:MAG: 3-dehydroquinate dehydratase II [Candidatus Tokpelaia sp. JSC085]|nr:MAG: 3-dehydroquinate dehydratase II [Candidatus Tokpelaia sp. JSC085]